MSTLPLWGKLLEWKQKRPSYHWDNDKYLSLYEGNYLNGNNWYKLFASKLSGGSPFMRETTWMETRNRVTLYWVKVVLSSPFMRETTWMETFFLYEHRCSLFSLLSLYEGNYLNGNYHRHWKSQWTSLCTLPLWGKLLEWKLWVVLGQKKFLIHQLSLYEGNYLNGNAKVFLFERIRVDPLPLWGKLLEWKRLGDNVPNFSNHLSLYEGNYLNGNFVLNTLRYSVTQLSLYEGNYLNGNLT